MLHDLAIIVCLFGVAVFSLLLGAATERARGFIVSEYDGTIVALKVLIIAWFFALIFLIFPIPAAC